MPTSPPIVLPSIPAIENPLSPQSVGTQPPRNEPATMPMKMARLGVNNGPPFRIDHRGVPPGGDLAPPAPIAIVSGIGRGLRER